MGRGFTPEWADGVARGMLSSNLDVLIVWSSQGVPCLPCETCGSGSLNAGAAPNAGRSPSDILMPGGQQVGRPGASSGVRRLNGCLPEAQKTFDELAAGGRDITPLGYPGELVGVPDRGGGE